MNPPIAKRVHHVLEKHHDVRIDPYYWLNQREDEEVLEYLRAENEYKEEILNPTRKLQEDLFKEITGRIKQTDMSVPYFMNGYFYQMRYEEGNEHPLYVRSKQFDKGLYDELLDVNELAEPHDYYQIGGLSVSPNNQYLAFGEDTVSRRIYTIRVKNLSTGEILEDEINTTTGRAVWANDNKTLFYTRKDNSLRAFKIFKHRMGTSQDEDVEIYHEEDDTFNTIVYKSKSGKYIIIASYATLSTEFRILDADLPDGAFRIFAPRQKKHEYYIDHHLNGTFFIRTNQEAKNFKLMETSEDRTEMEHWREILPHRQDVLLEDVEVFRDFIVLSERQHGLTHICVRPLHGDSYYIPFDEPTYTVYPGTNRDFESSVLRFGYTSLVTPITTYDFDMQTQVRTQMKQQEVEGGYDPSLYASERLYATARDGERVPISIIYPRDLERNGQAPLLVYGYGSYGHSIDPTFNSARLSLLERGFSFAIAHIRGGQEMGRDWYEQGKFLKKKNTFFDFIDCTRYLQEEGFSSPEKTFALGGSAGGLLIGAVINESPELYRGVIAAVPFVDVVTTMLDDSIPLTTGEYDEWGNPNDEKYYHYMKSYSPYDNVRKQQYPALLVTTGLHDSQVQYWEPAKWVAKMRSESGSKNPILLHTNMETGHSGASGRFKRHRETALEFAFLLWLLEENN